MARGLHTTLGTASTDVVNITSYAAIQDLTTVSISLWTNRRATQSQFSSLLTKGPTVFAAGSGDWRVYGANVDASTLSFEAGRWQTTVGVWTIPAPLIGVDFRLVIVYDYGSTANDPAIYIDGVAQTVTRVTAPAGTLASTSLALLLGNRTDGLRCWDGQIAEFAVWNGLLDAAEAAALGKGYAPSLIRPASLVGYWPLIGRSSPEVNSRDGQTGTVTGALVQPHPRIIMPSRVFVGVAAAAPQTYEVAIAETAAATDTPTAQDVLAAAISEAAAATDTPTAQAVLVAAINEVAAVSDSPAAQAVLVAAINEALAASDTPTALAVLTAAINETAVATDTPTAGLGFGAAVDETAAATDSPDAVVAKEAAIAETAAATDAPTAQVVGASGVSEQAAATDAPAAQAVLGAGVSEAAVATDAPKTGGLGITGSVFGASISESAVVTDSPEASVLAGGPSQTYEFGVVETAAATASATAAVTRTLSSNQKALTTARLGCARLGAFRLGYAPKHTRSATVGSTTGPLERWQKVYAPGTTWTRVSA